MFLAYHVRCFDGTMQLYENITDIDKKLGDIMYVRALSVSNDDNDAFWHAVNNNGDYYNFVVDVEMLFDFNDLVNFTMD